MAARFPAAAALAAAVWLLATAAAQGVGAVPDFPLDEVVPGLEGFGLTAAPGGDVARFDVTVLAVQEDAGPGFPLVLVRASGELIAAAGGVAAGMSGSPVYLERGGRDALLGAIGYVFPEADHDFALVTPIAAMRDSTVAGAPPTVSVAGLGTAVPAAVPVLMAGATERTAALVAELFDDAPSFPLVAPRGAQGGGGGVVATRQPRLEPGAAVAAQLISGDLQLAALGTLTAVDGVALLAFGHPLLGSGHASYGVAQAAVTALVPSDVVPFKLANLLPGTVGAFTYDTPAALVGSAGVAPATVPLTITVTAGTAEGRYEVELAAAADLYPTLAAVATLSAIERTARSVTPGRAELAWEVALASGPTLNVAEQVTSEEDIGLAAARLAGGPLEILARNRFADPGVLGVDLSVTIATDPGSADVAEVVVEQEDELTAGGHAVVHVRLQPYREEAVVRTFSVPLPDDLTGEVTLLARGGDVPREIEGAPDEGGEVDEPRTFPELLDALRDQVQASELVFESVDEHGDVRRLLRVPLPWVIIGSQELHVTLLPADGADDEDAGQQGAGGEQEAGGEQDASGEQDEGGGHGGSEAPGGEGSP